ncbi:hypothetical protein IRZ53_17440 [Pseudomonas fulva]|uniref:hypothetical protein n=1 Tax=Pseudomonas fulva TaxID=47880 RepID=UPI0018A9AEBF|nr:hypothetical protein [Pseudomonas fulva]MBF8676182.1 hypothetical protein [Pseudomonas fulva]MBF8698570.1 hypothetical protein [Pseudomonas fulva]
MSASNELAAVPPKETALQVFQVPNGLEPYLQKIRDEIDAFVPDVSTRKGREAIASIAYKVARSKTALDNVGKELVAELKDIPKKIDAERKRMRDTLDAWQEEVRRPLTAWQAADDDRVDRHQARIQQLRDLMDVETLFAEGIRFKISQTEAVVVDEGFEEFESEAHQVKAKTLESLRASLTRQEKHEAEQAEIERLREEAAAREQKEREERIAREAEDRARREAEQKAQAEREAAQRREMEAKASAERRELELKLQAEQAERARVQAEADRVASEQRLEKERQASARRQEEAAEQARQEERRRADAAAAEILRQQESREADKAHRGSINRAALEAFIAEGMPEACAKQAVTLIAQRKIPNIAISY